LGIVKKKTKEQMNKDFNSFMTVVIMMIVVGAFVGLLIEPYPLPLEFNPDTDVCLEWKECKTINYLGECKEWRNINFPDGLHKCFEWRPKNKCKLDPESEGCICDEWKGNYGDCSGKIIFYPDAYLIEKNISWSENRNITIGLKECLDEGWCECRGDYIIKKTNCIKAHEPTEQEIEAKKWILTNNKTQTQSIYLSPWEAQDLYYDLEEGNKAFIMPNKYKFQVSNISLVKVEEEFSCVINCPNSNSLEGCETSICTRNWTEECYKLDGRYFENNCKKELKFTFDYTYQDWRYSH